MMIILLWCSFFLFFFFNDTATTEIYTLSLHDALPISWPNPKCNASKKGAGRRNAIPTQMSSRLRSVRPQAGGCPTGVVFGRFALSMGVIWPGSSLVRLGSDSSGKDAPPVARDQIVAVPACSAPAGFRASAHELRGLLEFFRKLSRNISALSEARFYE